MDPIDLPPLTSQLPTLWKGERSIAPTEGGRVTSVSDPSRGSADSKVHYACQKDSDTLGNQFCATAIEAFDQNPPVTWATSRPKVPVLQRVGKYMRFCLAR